MVYRTVLTLATLFLLATGTGCSGGPAPAESAPTGPAVQKPVAQKPAAQKPAAQKPAAQSRRLTAGEAVKQARGKLPAGDWKLAFLSNTGMMFGSTTSGDLAGPEEALMQPDGTAGQWVVEFFRDEPERVSEGGRTGLLYPFAKVLVTKKRSSLDSRFQKLAVPKGLVAISDAKLKGLEKARGAALETARKEKTRFDVLSVASQNPSSGDFAWYFGLYDLKSDRVTRQVLVSGEGGKVLKTE